MAPKNKIYPINPQDEGAIKRIYEWFFKPLRQYKPETMTLSEWNETLFDSRNVEILQYRARRDFTLPGLYHRSPQVKIQGLGYRAVNKGDMIEVQYFGGPGQKDQLFTLNQSEWNAVAANLQEVD